MLTTFVASHGNGYASIGGFVNIAVMVPTINRKQNNQDHSARLFQFFPAVSRKLSAVIGLDVFTRRATVAANSPPENNSE
jgi:hypothetical protein